MAHINIKGIFTVVILLTICVYKHGVDATQMNITSKSATRIVISNNVYGRLLVAISPSVKENDRIIPKIKEMFNEASSFLYKATRKRAYFGYVKILVPETWTKDPSWITGSTQTFEEADIRIDKPSPLFGNDPYTFQPEGCGDPGKYIHLTEEFILDAKGNNIYTYGTAGRVLVHEFSHLRYGVFDEYGLGTDEYPNFYIDGNVAYPTLCTEGIRGKTMGNCAKDPNTNLPGKDCFFVANATQNTAKASVMYDSGINTVTTFCESGTDDHDILHNSLAPNQQNKMCDKKGTWDVIKEHVDFKGANPPVDKTEDQLKVSFSIVYGGKATIQSNGKEYEVCGRPVVLVLDVSGSMNLHNRLFKQRQTASKLISDILPVGTQVGIVSFGTFAHELLALTPLATSADRTHASNRLPKVTTGSTSIGSGLRKATEMLTTSGVKSGGRIVLITDGEENVAPMVDEVVQEILDSNIKVHAVAYSKAASTAIQKLTDNTGGTYAFYSENTASTALDSAMEELMKDITICNKMSRLEIIRTAKTLVSNIQTEGTVTIDPTLRNDTMFVFTLPLGVQVTITLKSPNGSTYTHNSPEYSIDDTLNIARYNFRTAQAGLWHYTLKSSSPGSVSLVVKALPVEGDDPYEVTSWLSSSAADLSASEKPVVVYIHVHKGYSPVIDAEVTVSVETPNGTPVIMKPKDKGILPDSLADDGVYSAYFTEYNGDKRYSVDVSVTNIPGKTTYFKHGPPTYGAALSRYHNTTTAVEKVLADNFTRTTSPGAMDVKGYTPGKDNFPPSRTTDLKVVAFDSENRTVTLTWTAPGDDYNAGTASKYEMRMAESALQLQKDFGIGLEVNQSMVISGSLKPKVANSKERLTVKTPPGWKTIVFALQTLDEEKHLSGVSNIAVATFEQVTIQGMPTVTTVSTSTVSTSTVSTVQTPEENPLPETNHGSDTAIIIAVVSGILGGFIIIGVSIVVVSRVQRGKKIANLLDPFEAQMTEPTVPVANTKYIH